MSVHSTKLSDHLYRRDMFMMIADIIGRKQIVVFKDDSTDVNWDVYNFKYVFANEPNREYYQRNIYSVFIDTGSL